MMYIPEENVFFCFIMGTTFAFVGTLFFLNTKILNCVSDNTFIKVIYKHNITWMFMLFCPGNLRCWVWIVVVLSLCFLLVLYIDDGGLPMYTAALSVALLMGNNTNFYVIPHHMFATFFLPSWWMVTFFGGIIILALCLNTVIAADVRTHTLNKQISKGLLWSGMMLYTTWIQTQLINLVKYGWVLHKYASDPNVQNWRYTW